MANRFGHQARMNKMFEGYEKRTILDKKGREKTTYVYVKEYYQPKISFKTFVIRKIIFVLILLVALALEIFAGIADIPMNHAKFMAVAECLGVLAIIVLGIYLFSNVCSTYRMEISSYRGAHEKLPVAAFIAALILAAVFITAIVASLTMGGFEPICLLYIAMYLVSACLILVVWYVEKNTDYEILPPDNY